nr:hypothetical protein [Tanacetum cinerariifolium]
MEIPDIMIDVTFKKTAEYKYYKAKKVESKKEKAVEEPKEQNLPFVKSGRGKGYMRSGENEANVSMMRVKGKSNEIDDADESDMDLIDDNLVRDDDVAGPSTVSIAKKLKEIIHKDKLTISDLEGAGLEKLKLH